MMQKLKGMIINGLVIVVHGWWTNWHIGLEEEIYGVLVALCGRCILRFMGVLFYIGLEEELS
jgi:hypothetical protein